MWVKDSNTWVLKERKLYLASDNETVITGITMGLFLETGFTFNPNADGKCVAWYDFTDILNLSISGDLVSKVSDKTDNNYDLIQTTDSYKPIYTDDGVYFNGIDNYMINSDIDKPQPTTYYLVAQYNGSDDGVLFDSTNDSNRNVLFVDFAEYWMLAGGWDTTLIPVDNNFVIYTAIFDFENSKLIINNSIFDDINLGASQCNLSGITVGAAYTLLGYFGNFYIKEMVIRDGVDDEAIQISIREYLTKKYNLTS